MWDILKLGKEWLSLKAIAKLESGIQEWTTPNYLFFKSVLRERLQYVKSVTRSGCVYYSVKANPHSFVLKEIANQGFGADVSSESELLSALNAGFRPSQISCVGPWKTDSFLSLAVERGVGRYCVESIDEARLVQNLVSGGAEIYARCFLPTSKEGLAENMADFDSQFGLSVEEIRLAEKEGVCFQGLHIYSGSDYSSSSEAVKVLYAIEQLDKEFGRVWNVQYGPGLGVSYSPHQADPEWSDLVDKSYAILKERNVDFEAGRYLVAHCAVLVVTVKIVKKRMGWNVCIADGGMTSFARTLLTKSGHPVFSLKHLGIDPKNRGLKLRLCGPTCTPLDRIECVPYFPDVDVGDQLIIMLAGAYGHNLNFDGFMGYKKAPFVAYEAD